MTRISFLVFNAALSVQPRFNRFLIAPLESPSSRSRCRICTPPMMVAFSLLSLRSISGLPLGSLHFKDWRGNLRHVYPKCLNHLRMVCPLTSKTSAIRPAE